MMAQLSGRMSCVSLLLLALALPLSAVGVSTDLTRGLIHYWSFDREDDKGMRDSAGDMPWTGHRRSGEWLTDGVAGEAVDIANGVYLDGTERDLAPPNLTIAGWIRYEAAASSSRTRAILSVGNHSSPLKKPWVFQLSEHKLAFAGGSKSVKTAEPVPEGRWVHVAAVVSTSEAPVDAAARTVRLYVDGCEVASGSVSIVPKAAQVLIGNTHRGGPDRLCGQVDELAIWDRTLSAEDITALHRLGSEGKALSSLVTVRPTVSIEAEKASGGGSAGTFVLERDNAKGTLRVHVSTSGLGIPDTDYAPLATIQTFSDGQRELRISVRPTEGATVTGSYDVKAVIEPSIFYVVSEACAARVWLCRDWPEPAPARPRKIYAHFMGCYPVAAAATAHHRAHDPPRTRHEGERQFDRGGDRWRNWPLVPDGIRLSLEEAADLDIRRAIRGGLDGFAVDAWAGRDDAKAYLSAMFAVAEAKDYPFELTICIDAGGLEHGTAAVKWLLDHHGNSPKLARRDGRPLVFGYLSVFPGFRHGASVLAKQPGNADKDPKELAKDPWLRTTREGWAILAQAQREMEKAAGQPIFWHYGMGAFFHQTPRQHWNHETLLDAATFMAGEFDAVGEFLGGAQDNIAEAVRAAGAEWSQPMYYQYENLFWGGNRIPRGSSILRRQWEAARRNQSTLIQFVTWNDYTENTHLAPAYETRYAVLDLNRHFIEWWKTGKEPRPQRDKLYLFFRKYPVDAQIYPFQPIQKESDGVIEVLSILTKPGVLRLPGRNAEWRAPAGLSWQHFPVTPGALKVELLRRNWYGRRHVVLSLESPESITDRPFRQTNSLGAISTEFERHWQADFGDAPPVRRGLYADDDGDGLPNWFEMYWFGKFLDWGTATGAEPGADPDSDGKTNLEEYRSRTDPTLAPADPTRIDALMETDKSPPLDLKLEDGP